MQLHVLGSAAGGGVPQWNCGCSNCTAARAARLPRRTQAALAASADGRSWVLFNASTDICLQLGRSEVFAPRAQRDSPVIAVFLTDANVDHCAGLLDFRQAGAWRLWSTSVVRDALIKNPVFAPFSRPPRVWECVNGRAVEIAGLRISALRVCGLLPSYAGGTLVDGAVTAYAIEDGVGTLAVYAPTFLEATDELRAAANRADAAFFDGSFWSDDEMIDLGLGARTAREMGHVPISGPGGSLGEVRAARCPAKFYTHLNNSNPLLDPSSPAARELFEVGVRIAEDGTTLTVSPTRREAEKDA